MSSIMNGSLFATAVTLCVAARSYAQLGACAGTNLRTIGVERTGFAEQIKAMVEWTPPGVPSRLVVSGTVFSGPEHMVGATLGAWDGARWTAIPGWSGPAIRVLSDWNGLLIAGGSTADDRVGPSFDNIGAFDGVQWRWLGGGLKGDLRALTTHAGWLVAGGKLELDGQRTTLAAWDGVRWFNLTPATSSDDGSVNVVLSFRDALYVGGVFGQVNGVLTTNVARFAGGTWQALPEGLTGSVADLDVWQNELIAAGDFDLGTATERMAGVARLDESGEAAAWRPIFDAHGAQALIVDDLALYVIGYSYQEYRICQMGGSNCYYQREYAPYSACFRDGRRQPFSGTGLTREPVASARYRGEWLAASQLGVLQLNGCEWLPIDFEPNFDVPAHWFPAFWNAGKLAGADGPVKWSERLWSGPCRRNSTSGQRIFTPVIQYQDRILTERCGLYTNVLEYDGDRFVVSTIQRPPGAQSLYSTGERLFAPAYDCSTFPCTAELMEWTGVDWQVIASRFWRGGGSLFFRHVFQVGDDLIVLGEFALEPMGALTYAARWDGVSWRAIEFPSNLMNYTALEWDDRVVVAGRTQISGNIYRSLIVQLQGDEFVPIPDAPEASGSPTSLFDMGRRMGMCLAGQVFIFDGTDFELLDTSQFPYVDCREGGLANGWLILRGEFHLPYDAERPNKRRIFSLAYVDCSSAGWQGDADCDGTTNYRDIQPFVLRILNPAAYEAEWPNCDSMAADMNGDGILSEADVTGFVRRLLAD